MKLSVNLYISFAMQEKHTPLKFLFFLGYCWNTELQPISLLQTDTLGNNGTTLILAHGEGKSNDQTKV